MKHKYCRTILTFASGVVVGVVGISFWELFGKPVLPKPEIVKHDLTYHFEPEYDGWAEQFNEPSAVDVDVLDVQEGDPVHAIHDGVVLVDHDESGYGKHVLVRHEPEPFPFVDMDVSEMSVVELKAYLEMKAKEDTQPVKVMESDWLKDTYQPCPEPQPVKVICLHENIRSIWRRPAWYYCPDCGKYFDINMSEMKPDWLAGKRAT